MPLIKCPECNKKISNNAKLCPKCGYPLRDIGERKISVEAEFSALRSEILNWQSSDTNVMIYMYVISITILGFAIQFNNSTLLFLIYFIVFLFELMLNSFRSSTARISAYIVVFLQTDSDKYIYWETDRIQLQNLAKKEGKITYKYFFSQQGSKIFTTIAFIYLICDNSDKILLILNCATYVVSMIILFSLDNFVDRQYIYYLELFKKYKKDQELNNLI